MSDVILTTDSKAKFLKQHESKHAVDYRDNELGGNNGAGKTRRLLHQAL